MNITNLSVAQPKENNNYLLFSLLLSVVIAVSAQIQIPLQPVPISLQTLAILCISLSFGRKIGVAAVSFYLMEGLIGLPVFAGFSYGPTVFVGPTGGYLIGFWFTSLVAGYFADNGWNRYWFSTVLAGIISVSFTYLVGVLWLSTFVGVSKAFALGVSPFMLGCSLKLVFLSIVVPTLSKFFSGN